MSAKRICRMALLTAVALTVFLVEAQLPPLAPIPGIKLGLSNIVTIWALFALGPLDAVLILLVRVLLGSVFAGQLMGLIYSLSGGLLCFLTTWAMKRVVTERQLWAASIVGAMAHNLGQLFAATAVMGSRAVWYYCPVLMISGILTGAFTGLAAQYLFLRLKKIRFFS